MSLTSKLIYLILLFVLLSLPHIRIGHIVSLPQATFQSLAMLALIGAAYTVYLLHERDVKRKEKEKKAVEKELKISSEKLMDAFKYIGLVNRRLPLLEKLTTELISKNNGSKKDKKDIFDDLLATAVTSVAKTSWGVFRFIDTSSEKTIKEFVYTNKHYALFKTKVSNKELLETRAAKPQTKQLDDIYVIATADRNSRVRCFFYFPVKKDTVIADELSLLQSIVDQAQLFYNYLFTTAEHSGQSH